MKKMFTVRCEEELIEKFTKLAKDEHRTLGNMLEKLIIEYKGDSVVREELIEEMKLAGIEDIDGIIKTVMIAVNTNKVDIDVIDIIRSDYLNK